MWTISSIIVHFSIQMRAINSTHISRCSANKKFLEIVFIWCGGGIWILGKQYLLIRCCFLPQYKSSGEIDQSNSIIVLIQLLGCKLHSFSVSHQFTIYLLYPARFLSYRFLVSNSPVSSSPTQPNAFFLCWTNISQASILKMLLVYIFCYHQRRHFPSSICNVLPEQRWMEWEYVPHMALRVCVCVCLS